MARRKDKRGRYVCAVLWELIELEPRAESYRHDLAFLVSEATTAILMMPVYWMSRIAIENALDAAREPVRVPENEGEK